MANVLKKILTLSRLFGYGYVQKFLTLSRLDIANVLKSFWHLAVSSDIANLFKNSLLSDMAIVFKVSNT